MLMAAGLAVPECVYAHGYLLVGGEKMSKTSLNQIAPSDLVPEFGSDGFRYHLVADVRFGQDGDFGYEAMVARYNADLANNFGNLASRVLNMAVSYCDAVVPETRADGPLAQQTATAVEVMEVALARLDYSDGFGAVWQLIRDANAYIEDSQPWALHKAGDAAAVAAVLGDCLEVLRVVAILASPLIPRAARRAVAAARARGEPRGRPPARGRRMGFGAHGRQPAREGRVALPAARRVTTDGPAGWVDSHCHLPAAAPRPTRSSPGPARAGSPGWWTSGPTSRPPGPRWPPRAGTPTSGRRSGSTPTMRAGGRRNGPS